jgi:hypothetical protein
MTNTPNHPPIRKLGKLGIAPAILLGVACLAGCEPSSWAESDAIGAAADSVTVEAPAAKATAKAVDAKPVEIPAEPAVEVVEAEPEIDANAVLTVNRLVIAHDVEAREPLGATTTFARGESDRIYAFVEVGNANSALSAIYVSFVRDGEPEQGSIELRVGESTRWRTWAYTRLAKEEGDYTAIVRNALGEELARSSFEIVSADPPRS